MREAGVDLSTGQGLGSQALMRMEGRLQPTEQQLADVTAATMRRFGSAEKIATPLTQKESKKYFMKFMKDGVNTALTKNFHIYLSLAALTVFAAVSLARYWDHDALGAHVSRKNLPGYK